MKKKLEWTKKPITWGGYFKLTAIASLLSVMITIGWCIYYFKDEVCDYFKEKFKKDKSNDL